MMEKESRLRAEAQAEQPSSGSEDRQRQPSPGSVERQQLVSPGSTGRQRKGSSHDRDTRDGSQTAAEEFDSTRRTPQMAMRTTLRR